MTCIELHFMEEMIFKKFTLSAAFFGLLTFGPAAAQTSETPDRAHLPLATGWSSMQTGDRPATALTQILNALKLQPRTNRPTEDMLDAIAAWLSENFNLPEMHERPAVDFITPRELFRTRYKALLAKEAGKSPNRESALFAAYSSKVVAIYKDATKTIALAKGWTGRTPAELSILVHEMVHHLQNLGNRKYACPAERERIAYEAQARWLKLFGYSLKDMFEIDSLTLLLSTRCIY